MTVRSEKPFLSRRSEVDTVMTIDFLDGVYHLNPPAA